LIDKKDTFIEKGSVDMLKCFINVFLKRQSIIKRQIDEYPEKKRAD